MRLESDTYSQLSHRAPLYIDPYYRGQIAIDLAVCLGTLGGKERRNRAQSIAIVHLTTRYEVILNIEGVLNVCLCVFVCVNAEV